MSRVNNLLDFCIEKVSEFHTTFGHPIATSKQVMIEIDSDLFKLRMRLVNEEHKEMTDAISAEDRLEILDGILDIFYVVAGAFLVYGLSNDKGPLRWDATDNPHVSADRLEMHLKYILGLALANYDLYDFKLSFEEAFGDVHASNMSKACTTKAQVKDTIADYKEQGIIVTSKQIGKLFIILRDDNKVLKNKYYTKVDLTKYL